MAGVTPGHPHDSYLKGFAPGYARTALLIATGLVTVNRQISASHQSVEQPKYRSHRTVRFLGHTDLSFLIDLKTKL